MHNREFAIGTIWRTALSQSLKTLSDGYGGRSIDTSGEGELEFVLNGNVVADGVRERATDLCIRIVGR